MKLQRDKNRNHHNEYTCEAQRSDYERLQGGPTTSTLRSRSNKMELKPLKRRVRASAVAAELEHEQKTTIGNDSRGSECDYIDDAQLSPPRRTYLTLQEAEELRKYE